MRLIFALFFGLFSISAWAHNPMELRHYGDSEKAPVHLYLFSSLACSHCGDFHKNILPDIQQKYVKTNKVYLTMVEMPVDKASIFGAALVRCQDKETAQKLEKRLYENQKQLFDPKDERAVLWNFAKAEGISEESFNQCLSNGNLMDKILEQRKNLSDLYGVEKMPTSIIRAGESVVKIEGADKGAVFEALDDLLTQFK